MFTDGDPRLGQLLDGIVRLAAGELDSRIEVSPARDELDAVIMGTNLLAEDLQIMYQELEQRLSRERGCSTRPTGKCRRWR
ncbi:protein involved in cyclic nucleotide biosynthetic process [Arthrobacter sp. Hiyo6]|nr:protein involved in cyclic nucleotide biosynthetic process [Arthrobacter sp. Hiyo6]